MGPWCLLTLLACLQGVTVFEASLGMEVETTWIVFLLNVEESVCTDGIEHWSQLWGEVMQNGLFLGHFTGC